jgi:uncharacterized protein DUF4154
MNLFRDRSAEENSRALNVNAPKLASRTNRTVLSRSPAALLFIIILLALCGGLVSNRAGETAPSEAQVKAAFLLNFPKYVQWPSATFPATNSPVVVGILDNEDVAAEFSTMSAEKVVDGHPIKLLRVTSVPECRECHILFIGSARKLPEILASLQGANVLTVGDFDDFNERGGMINLARRDRRIVLEVNLDAIRQAQLKVSSKLMALATVKGGKK